MEVTITIDYISWGETKPNPNYVLVEKIISQDGIQRWTRIVENITYKVNDDVIDVSPRDIDLFRKWTGVEIINGKFLLSQLRQTKCKCPVQIKE